MHRAAKFRDLPTVPNSYRTLFALQPYPRSNAFYEVSLRQTGCLPPTSFRFRIDTEAYFLSRSLRTGEGLFVFPDIRFMIT